MAETPKDCKTPRNAGLKPSLNSLQFGEDRSFEIELRKKVDQFFEQTGRKKRDCWQMYLKTAILLTCFVFAYMMLVFEAETLWLGLPLAALLGLSTAAIGFNIQHDGGHNAYSARPWVNRLMAMTLDLIGGSSYIWRWKHTLIHHRYVNIVGYDTDINLGFLGRLAPHQKRLAFHRWQHLYLWPLYGLLAIKWQLVDDFRCVLTGRLGPHPLPRPKGWNLLCFIGGKVVFFSWVFAVPLLFHPIGLVVFYYIIIALMLGMVLSSVFQVPHCGEGASFPLPKSETGRIEDPWAVHQARVTADFAQHNRSLTWFLGGLNYHLEHHLFPIICHVNYRAMSEVVEQTCREFGIPYRAHKSFLGGLVSHFRWLRRVGADNRNC